VTGAWAAAAATPGGILEPIVTPADDIDRALADLVGHPLDEFAPALVVRSARRLDRRELEGLVHQGLEERELLDAGDVVLEVVFDLAQETGPWVWRLGVDPDDLPGADEDLSTGEYLRGELTWRLIEWRDTRDEQRAHAAPRLLRAS
jgi:hypothetical protein